METEWVPVKDRNPDFSGKYLVSTIYEAVVIRSYDTVEGWGKTNGMTIIAWMDIPEPYVSKRMKEKREKLRKASKT